MNMKNALLISCLFTALSLGAQDNPQGQPSPAMNNMYDSLSYFLGLSLGYELQSPPFEANKDLILEGFVSAFQGKASVDQQAARMEFQSLQFALQEQEAQKAGLEAQAALEEGTRFLEENGKREGVVTTPSGLQYEVIVSGDGPLPADTSEVEVHYHGTLIDGTVFDSSMDRGEPVSFPLDRVIPGWTEGVQLMPVGSTYIFYIPPALGYGSRATGPIPANSVLIFKVQLLDIK
jgi:FKBP-type peptidyl-prolyl cis-trans isomerase FkpA